MTGRWGLGLAGMGLVGWAGDTRHRLDRHDAATMTRRRIWPWLLALVGGLLLGAVVVWVAPFISLASLAANRQALSLFTATRPVGAAAVFVGLYIVFAALPVPGAELLTIAAGALFGLVEGVILVSFASSIGATLAFVMSRLWLRGIVERRFPARLRALSLGIQDEGAFYLFALRLIPIVPFFLVNLLMGLTGLRVLTFYWVSQVGMLPATVAYVNAGLRLAQVRSLSGILSMRVLFSFAILGFLPLASRWLVKLWRGAMMPGPRPGAPDA